MEEELDLASGHGVPVGQLRGVRLVPELQGLLERRRSAAGKKKSSAGAWRWKWEKKLEPKHCFSLPESYSEARFGRLVV
jgi:hypothetical protein